MLRPSRLRRTCSALLVASALAGVSLANPPTAVQAVDGTGANCGNFEVTILGLIGVATIPEPGWVWVDPSQKFQDVVGEVTKSRITHTDFPTIHDSHDQNTDVLVDPGYEDLLSTGNSAGKIELEWEIGTFPGETSSDPERLFPKWAWPNLGDRVWANGNWIFDCGHPKEIDGADHYKTEIHPPRAFASMRDQVRTMPGRGTTPVPVTATDLYIHGRAGFVGDDLQCGQEIIISAGTCTPSAFPHRGRPIDVVFEFVIQSPPKPFPTAVLATFVENVPESTLSPAPVLLPNADGSSVHVTIPLAGSGATPDDVYARKIYTGWVFPPASLRHLTVTLNQMDLHDDMDTDPGDCECTFFWMNVDRAAAEWIRMSTFADGNMNDYDDDDGFGDGEMDFSGAGFDFYVANGQDFRVRAHGYDQDCLDDLFGDGNHVIGAEVGGVLVPNLNALALLDCYIGSGAFTLEPGDNDNANELDVTFTSPGYGVGSQDVSAGGQYELEFDIGELALTNEDAADLSLTKTCTWEGEVALAGSPFDCTITVENAGPGLPRNVVVTDDLVTSATSYTVGPASFTFEDGFAGPPNPCTATSPSGFSCELGTVPVGGSAIITVEITPGEGGDYLDQAEVTTDSTDADLTNNSDEFEVRVFRPVEIDIKPGGGPNKVKLSPNTLVTVAILTTPDFDATTVDASSVCFGDAEDPTQRDCTEAHGTGHVEDVDRDGDLDMVLHYESLQTGIDLGDTQACLIGEDLDGIGIYGCDSVEPH
jgi:hypothetical protein